jgi:hypothetical protein
MGHEAGDRTDGKASSSDSSSSGDGKISSDGPSSSDGTVSDSVTDVPSPPPDDGMVGVEGSPGPEAGDKSFSCADPGVLCLTTKEFCLYEVATGVTTCEAIKSCKSVMDPCTCAATASSVVLDEDCSPSADSVPPDMCQVACERRKEGGTVPPDASSVPPEAGSVPEGGHDAEVHDAGTSDTGAHDTGTHDSGTHDAEPKDASTGLRDVILRIPDVAIKPL